MPIKVDKYSKMCYNISMRKTDEYIQLANTTMYFPKVQVTIEELTNAYKYGHVQPNFLRQVVSDTDMVNTVINTNKKTRPNSSDGYDYLVNKWTNYNSYDDVVKFSNGRIDTIDLVFKYSIPYKKLRQSFKDLLPDVDVDNLWKKHKKYAQKQTSKIVYGVDHVSMLQDVQDKRTQTTQERYGVDNAMQSQALKDKYKQTMLDKYGVEHNFQMIDAVDNWKHTFYNTLILDKRWATILGDWNSFTQNYNIKRRYFVVSLNTEPVDKLLTDWATLYGAVKYPDNTLFKLPFQFSSSWLKYYHDKQLCDVNDKYLTVNISQYEKLLIDLFDSHNIEYQRNVRTILNGLELDFYFPKLSLAIEVNPNKTHNSNLFAIESDRVMFDSVKEKTYHYNKYKLCADKGITLIQLYSFDLEPVAFHTKTTPRLLQQILGYDERIYARKVSVSKIGDIKEARAFLNQYHTQGAGRAQDYYEFRYNGDLVAVASFTRTRNNDVELKRLCFKPGIQIIGGLSKLIKTYFRDTGVESILSYSDNNYGNGDGYAKAGAEFLRETGPSLVFISPTNSSDRYSWQVATPWSMKSGIISKDVNWENQTDNPQEYVEKYLSHKLDAKVGYDAIYTAGSKLWKFVNKG